MTTPSKPARVVKITPAGPDNRVLTVEGGKDSYRRRPCPECPWRQENTGSFPPSAFEASANTSYDMSTHMFGCHMSKAVKPATCAGFLLQGAGHNLSFRLAVMGGRIDPSKLSADGANLFENYRAMAVANGLSPDAPALQPCRDDTQIMPSARPRR